MKCFLSVFNQFFNTRGYPGFISLMRLHNCKSCLPKCEGELSIDLFYLAAPNFKLKGTMIDVQTF